jgi:outer membrane lipoprotein
MEGNTVNMGTKRDKLVILCVVLFSGLIMASCASVISKSVMKEVDPNLGFEQLKEDPGAYVGKIVLLGGSIIKTENISDKTNIFILQRPLEFRDEPSSKDISKGRFILTVPGFLDPEIYCPGRKITVAGEIMGKEVHSLDEIDYTYPVIAKKELYLWPLEGYPEDRSKVHFGFGIHIGL